MAVRWKYGKRLSEEGGFGEVFKVKKEVNGEIQPGEYVLKRLKKDDEESIDRFKREVRYLKALDHPRIVKWEGGRLKQAPFFYTMKKYKHSLKSIQKELAHDYKRILTVYNGVLEGLEYLHEEGYYHRDLKPGNVLLNSDSDLVLCDLGLCVSPLYERGDRITRTYMGIGTDYYCSPEQLKSLKKTDHRTDIYAFGKMLYETFTQERPDILDFSKVPPEVQFIIKKCTYESPSERFSHTTELRKKFNRAMEFLLEGTHNDLKSIVKSMDESEDVTNFLPSLAEALSALDDIEELHESIMIIKGEFIGYLYENYPDLVGRIITEFIEFVREQMWPFSYTDTLGDKIKELYQSIHNSSINICLLKGILKLSVYHNRWYVMGLFVEMLYTVNKEDDFAHEIFHELSDDENDIERIKSNINIKKSKLHPTLRELF